MQKRLPQVPYLKVKDTRIGQRQGTCAVALTSLLTCWASNGEGANACKQLELELKQCMAGHKHVKQKRSTVNYHSNRLLSKVNPKPHD